MAATKRRVESLGLSREAELFASLVSIAGSQISADDAMRRCLTDVCEFVGWHVGHVYVDSADGSDELSPTDIWHLDDPESFAEFREITSNTRFASGVGLPGRVLELGEPVWIPDVQIDTNFPRN